MTLRIESAVVLEESNDGLKGVLTTLCAQTLLTLLLCSSLFLLASDRILIALSLSDDFQLVVILFVAAIHALIAITSNFLTRLGSFSLIALARIVFVCSLPIFCTVGLNYVQPSSATYTFFASMALMTQGLILVSGAIWSQSLPYKRQYYFNNKLDTVKNYLFYLKKYRVYPYYMVPYTLSASISLQFQYIAISMTYGATALGSYVLIRQLAYAPASILANSFRNISFSYSSRVRNNPSELKQFFRDVLSAILLLVVPIYFVAFTYIETLIETFLGDIWIKAAEYSRYVLIASFSISITSWADKIFEVIERQRDSVWLQVSADLCLILFCVIISFYLSINDVVAIQGLSLISFLFNSVWIIYLLSKVGISFKQHWRYFLNLSIYFVLIISIMHFLDTVLANVYLKMGLWVLFMCCLTVWTYHNKLSKYFHKELNSA